MKIIPFDIQPGFWILLSMAMVVLNLSGISTSGYVPALIAIAVAVILRKLEYDNDTLAAYSRLHSAARNFQVTWLKSGKIPVSTELEVETALELENALEEWEQ